jgi:hypothetical protein
VAARDTAIRALIRAETIAFRQQMIHAHLLLAALGCAIGDAHAAATHLDSAEALKPRGARGWDPYLLFGRSELALLRGETATALRLAEQATALAEEGTLVDRCLALVALGRARLACGHLDTALATFERLIDRAGSISMRCRQADGYEGAAAACVALARVEARDYWSTAAEIRQATSSRRSPNRAIDDLLASAGLDRTDRSASAARATGPVDKIVYNRPRTSNDDAERTSDQ